MIPRVKVPVAMEVKPAASEPTEHNRSNSNRLDNTDISNSADRSKLRTQAGVRVRVNLQQFFSDQRARAFMWAPYNRCVEWLGQRISYVFGLPDDIALMSCGHLLPVNEPLLILDRDDPVEVVKKSDMFTTDYEQNYLNVTSYRAVSENSSITERPRPNEYPVQSNLTINEEDPVTIQSGNRECESFSRVSQNPVEIENTISSQDSQVCEKLGESQDLQRLKQQALRLLDEHCHKLHDSSVPKRLRRRRRRRKLQSVADEAVASDGEEPQSTDATPEPQDTSVLRNGFGSRAPRLVRALSPPPVLEYAV